MPIDARRTALAEAAKICWAEFDSCINDRDAALRVGNHEGALTRARQAQTAEGLAKAIEAVAARDERRAGS
jgi:hypothetical protein